MVTVNLLPWRPRVRHHRKKILLRIAAAGVLTVILFFIILSSLSQSRPEPSHPPLKNPELKTSSDPVLTEWMKMQHLQQQFQNTLQVLTQPASELQFTRLTWHAGRIRISGQSATVPAWVRWLSTLQESRQWHVELNGIRQLSGEHLLSFSLSLLPQKITVMASQPVHFYPLSSHTEILKKIVGAPSGAHTLKTIQFPEMTGHTVILTADGTFPALTEIINNLFQENFFCPVTFIELERGSATHHLTVKWQLPCYSSLRGREAFGRGNPASKPRQKAGLPRRNGFALLAMTGPAKNLDPFQPLLFTMQGNHSPPAVSPLISLEEKNIPLTKALRLLSGHLRQNILIHEDIQGTVSLSLHDMSAKQALDSLIKAHDLILTDESGIPEILSREKLLQQKQQNARWRTAMLATEPLETRLFQIRYSSADATARPLMAKKGLLSERGSLHIDERTNQIIVQDTPATLQRITDLIRQIDIPVQQVLIETHLASVDTHFERELGLDFSVTPNHSEKSGHKDGMSGQGLPYSLVFARLADGSALDIRLAALENSGHGELISSPRLFTANRQPATIESGEEIPYQEISRSGATGVAFRKAVLSLQVTPQILPNHLVELQLKINQDKPASRIIQGVPAITTRQISSNILVKNGQTIVLGGIYENDETHAQTGIPFLNRLPLIGSLFEQQHLSSNRRELLIFVTPRIIDPP